MADKTEQFGNRIMLTGVVSNKQLRSTATGKDVLNVYVRTKTSRGSFFGIGVEFWGDRAKAINRQLANFLPDVEDGERIQENDSVVVTVEGELKENSWEDREGNKRSRFLLAGEKLSVED